jgi:hypothetical protein
MSKPTIDEQINALNALRQIARDGAIGVYAAIAKAINTLDDADLFADIDQEHDAREAAGQERLNERARQALLHNARHVPAEPTHDPR